jgi:CARDB
MQRDDDIEFDFFEEPEPAETLPPGRRAPRRRGTGPRRPVRPAAGFTPLLRLVGLVAFAILIVVLLVIWVQGCRDNAKKSSYRSYMEKVGTIASASAQDGKELTTVLTTTGLKVAEIESRLRGLADQERQNVASAEDLSPPGPLRPEHRDLIEALQFRVSGLNGMADTLRKRSGSKDVAGSAELLAAQAERLEASDVVWDDLFKDPSIAELQKQVITGVAVPDSTFVTTPDLATIRTLQPFLQRLQGASTGGTPSGLHGTNIESVKALPNGQQLVPGQTNTVVATTDLGFQVAIKDSGDSQEVGIKVTLTIQKSPQPIVKNQTIDLINAGETKTVEFHNLGQVPFAQKVKVKVDVSPVAGEKNKTNNSASYDVIFSLG